MIYVGMGESRCGVAANCAGRGLLWAGGRRCCAVCALGNMKLWRGSCFDVHSSIHRKPCPAKIGLWGSYGSLGSRSVGRSTKERIPVKNRTRVGTSSLRSRAVLFFSYVDLAPLAEVKRSSTAELLQSPPSQARAAPPRQLTLGGPPQCFSPQLSIRPQTPGT